jgi:uncharacterized cupin superfamily protein
MTNAGIVRIDTDPTAFVDEPTGVGTPARTSAQTSTATGFSAGIWEAEPFDEDFPDGYGMDEFITILEGTIVLRTPDGTEHRFEAGDSFTIARDAVISWHQPARVKKIFVIQE